MPTSSPTILVVDDSEPILALEKRVLERAGFTVVTARTGEEAMKRAAECSPDLVVLDVVLPDVDGVILLQKLREVTGAPAVLVSGKKTTGAEKAEGLEKGADDYITKPFAPSVLVARVRAVLRRTRHRFEER